MLGIIYHLIDSTIVMPIFSCFTNYYLRMISEGYYSRGVLVS